MISSTNLDSLAIKLQTSSKNVYREYLQHLFLSIFYSQKSSGLILFKGGTALRLVFRSPRFSEDLDFSLNKLNYPLLESTIENTLLEISRLGLNPSLIEAKPTTGGYLSLINCPMGNVEIKLLLQFSSRHHELVGENASISSDFIPLYPTAILSKYQLVAEKVQALLSRHKPRDYYDIYFLLRSGMLGVDDKKHLVEIKNLLSTTTINFDDELKEYLPKSHWMIIKDFKRALSQELDRFTR